MIKVKKLAAICLAGILTICFASCKPDSSVGVSTTVSSTESTVPVTTDATESTQAATTAVQRTNAEIVELYNAAYNKTKATGTFLGTDQLNLGEMSLSGKVNPSLTKMCSGFGSMFFESKNTNILPPMVDGFETSKLTEADLSTIHFEDRGASYYIRMVPVDSENPTAGSPGAGRLFDVSINFVSYFEKIPGFTWTQGTTADNVKTIYSGGYCEVVIDKATGLFTSATYESRSVLHIDNAKIGISINDASVEMIIVTKYPA